MSPSTTAAMRANRRADTKPELRLRSLLWRQGYRFRKDFRLDLASVRVRPDVVFTRPRVAIFVDGCFWHGCPAHCRLPTRNHDYWTAKIAGNQARGHVQDTALRREGWTVLRFWEHDVLEATASEIAKTLSLCGTQGSSGLTDGLDAEHAEGS